MTKLIVDPIKVTSKIDLNNKCKQHDTKAISKFEIIKRSLKIVTKEYCYESSICGLKHLVDENDSNFERWIWKFVMIGALFCSGSLVWVTFDKYYEAPLVTTQLPEGISVNKIPFPAIGICTTNRISRKAVKVLANKLLQEERNKEYNENEMVTLLSGLGYMYNLQAQQNSTHLTRLHHALGDYDVNKLLRELTPRCEDLLLNCAWNEITKKCTELFDFRLTMNGYCCTFNYLRPTDYFVNKINADNIDMTNYGNKSAYDFDQGLKALILFDDSDDFYYNLPLEGALVQFSDAYDFPDAPSGAVAAQILSSTVQMTVEVSASLTEASRDIQHVALSLRRCLFHDESPYLTFYTLSNCILKCRLLFLLENCKCTPFNMPKLENTRTCNLLDLPCLKTFYAQSIAVRPDVDPLPEELELHLVGGGIVCSMCYPACSKTAYSFEFDNVNIFPNFLNDLPDRNRDEWLEGANFTGTSILHVRYANEVAECYEQNVIMKWFDLFSNIGSTCGFVTGFSFVSVLEFLYFFIVKLYREVKAHNRTKHDTPAQRRDRARPAKPTIAKRQPLYWNELTGNIPDANININFNKKKF